jgi:Domain of unknown function (DUF4832)/Domain of unknown function (DUF4874)
MKLKNTIKVVFITLTLISSIVSGYAQSKVGKTKNSKTNAILSKGDSKKDNSLINTTTLKYVGDFATAFPNPERGWHGRRDIKGLRNEDTRDFPEIKAKGITLIHSYIRLDNFKEIDVIPTSYLNDLQKALDSVRANGFKIILRPTYVWSETPTVPEARILKHIEQLNAVISKNADIINHLEVGYLGKWGEWHSGRYTDLSSRIDGDTRYRIIKRILDTSPGSMPIALRYPMHIREILDEIPVPEGSEPLTKVQRDRLGHHGDCFLFNDDDRGTYARLDLWFGNQSLEQQKQYAFNLMTSYGGNKIMGGETCSPAIDRIADTQNDMAKLNWTEININFWEDAIEMWKKHQLPASGNDPEESEFSRISRKLGYRLRLVEASFPTSLKSGDQFTIAANLNNDGFASIIKKRSIYLVFDNGLNRYNIELTTIDPRTWVSGAITLNPQTVILPKMVAGKYKLALWLPDAAEKLHFRPEYSIRFANKDVWDATKGYNVLTDSLIINP